MAATTSSSSGVADSKYNWNKATARIVQTVGSEFTLGEVYKAATGLGTVTVEVNKEPQILSDPYKVLKDFAKNAETALTPTIATTTSSLSSMIPNTPAIVDGITVPTKEYNQLKKASDQNGAPGGILTPDEVKRAIGTVFNGITVKIDEKESQELKLPGPPPPQQPQSFVEGLAKPSSSSTTTQATFTMSVLVLAPNDRRDNIVILPGARLGEKGADLAYTRRAVAMLQAMTFKTYQFVGGADDVNGDMITNESWKWLSSPGNIMRNEPSRTVIELCKFIMSLDNSKYKQAEGLEPNERERAAVNVYSLVRSMRSLTSGLSSLNMNEDPYYRIKSFYFLARLFQIASYTTIPSDVMTCIYMTMGAYVDEIKEVWSNSDAEIIALNLKSVYRYLGAIDTRSTPDVDNIEIALLAAVIIQDPVYHQFLHNESGSDPSNYSDMPASVVKASITHLYNASIRMINEPFDSVHFAMAYLYVDTLTSGSLTESGVQYVV
jgi:hypothetical protein